MITTARSGDVSMPGDLSTKSCYRCRDLVNLGEHHDRGKSSVYARGDRRVEDEEPHWRRGGVDVDMGFFDEHSCRDVG